MKKLLAAGFFLASCLLLPASSYAQFTTVTATVQDPNGIPYSGAIMNAILVPGASGGYRLGGQPYSGRVGPVTLDINGSFTAQFGDVTLITPGSPQWQITIDSAAATILPSLGTGPQSFTYTSSGTTISGSSPVSLTTALNALAPKLTNFASGGSGTISCAISAAVLFETAANTAGCATGFTFSTPNLTIPLNGAYEINGVPMLFSPGQGSSLNNLGVGGPSTLSAITTGVNNVAVGPSTMNLTTSGSGNTAVGTGALGSEAAGASNNTAVGWDALPSVTSSANTAIGEGSLASLISGNKDTAVGTGSGGITTGSSNTFVGFVAGGNTTTGGSNIILGADDNNTVTTGSGNLVIGNALSGITNTSSNQLDVMDAIIGTGMNVPATSTVEYKGNLKIDGTCTGCSSGVTSFSGDGTIITNSASTGAVTATIAGTSGGQPYFNSASSWASTGVLANHAIQTGGGAGGAPTTGNGDFTIDSTAHTLLAGAAGLVDLHAEATSGFKPPASASTSVTAAGALMYSSQFGSALQLGTGASQAWMAWAGAVGSGSTTCSSAFQYVTGISAIAAPTCSSLAVAGAFTSQRNETATDNNVLTVTPNAAPESFRVRFVLSVSAATAAVLGWTITWKDSNGNAQSPTNLTLTQSGSALPALTFTTSAAGDYYGQADIDVDNSATNIVVKFLLTGGTITAKATATIERII
jgi:hypothetical protein